VSLDEKYSTVLAKLEEQQAAKDRPQQRVIDIDTEELSVQISQSSVHAGDLADTAAGSDLASNR
jgi:hypothetical protein